MHAAAGVAGGAAQVEARIGVRWSAQPATGRKQKSWCGAHRALHDVAAGDAVDPLQVERR